MARCIRTSAYQTEELIDVKSTVNLLDGRITKLTEQLAKGKCPVKAGADADGRVERDWCLLETEVHPEDGENQTCYRDRDTCDGSQCWRYWAVVYGPDRLPAQPMPAPAKKTTRKAKAGGGA